ncbi:MAG: CoA transferase [Alphaproteobacteria bacterium]|nr:CoA transferase [Alphaproteobacteria bacterium]
MGALAHLRVLDLSRVLAGPWSGQIFADLGADVVKVERPGAGDDTRAWGPPFLKRPDGSETREAAYYLSTNRGKRSITVDFTRTEGQALVRRLAAEADVLLENYKAGGLKKFGLDFETLQSLNPRLVYCSITGYGQTGPYADHAGYDLIIEAMGGFMSITGERDDKPGGGPQKAGVAVADLMTGLYSTVAVLAALLSRAITGKGQHLDMCLMDCQVAWLANQSANYLIGGMIPVRVGNAHPNIVPYGTYPASDGYIVLGIGNEGQFRKFLEIAGRPEIADDPRFLTNRDRVAHRTVLEPMLEAITRTRTMDEWIVPLDEVGVPAGPINTLDRVFADPQVKAREMVVDVMHSLGFPVPSVASPIKMLGTPVQYRNAAPLLGEHTEEVLAEWLGLASAEIDVLKKSGVL